MWSFGDSRNACATSLSGLGDRRDTAGAGEAGTLCLDVLVGIRLDCPGALVDDLRFEGVGDPTRPA